MQLTPLSDTIERLRTRLQSKLPGNEAHSIMFPGIKDMPEQLPADVKLSAVMALFFLKDNEWQLLTIKRTEDGKAHSGQVSFPGGRQDPSDEDAKDTALRETFEEIGVAPDAIDVIGALSPLYIVVSNFQVFPYVGILKENGNYNISVNEVTRVLEIPLNDLFSSKAKVAVEVSSPAFPDIVRKVNAYQLQDGTVIWGATAMMIAELEMIWKEIGA